MVERLEAARLILSPKLLVFSKAATLNSPSRTAKNSPKLPAMWMMGSLVRFVPMQHVPHHGMNDHDAQPRYAEEKNAKANASCQRCHRRESRRPRARRPLDESSLRDLTCAMTLL
jgi:hypothetical protein